MTNQIARGHTSRKGQEADPGTSLFVNKVCILSDLQWPLFPVFCCLQKQMFFGIWVATEDEFTQERIKAWNFSIYESY